MEGIDNMTKAIDKQAGQGAAVPVSRDAVLANYANMITAVPEATDDDGSGIIANVLMAGDWESLNGSDGLPDAADFVGEVLVFRSITRRESTVPDSPSPWYLVVEADTGAPLYEPRRFSTSAATVMAQLVKAHIEGWLPLIGTITKPDKATRAGRFPLAIKFGGRVTD